MDSCWGSRCCTTTTAMPVFAGRFASRSLSASRPPAEAPTPTTANGASLDRIGSMTLRLSAGGPACNDSQQPILTSVSLPSARGTARQQDVLLDSGASQVLYHAVYYSGNR